MKISRHKKAKRILSFFKNNFGHHPPFQVLIEGTFAQECLRMKVNIRDQLPKYFGEDVKLLTTKCCILEVERIGADLAGALHILKQFPVHKCPHDGQAQNAGFNCILGMLAKNNPNRYIVAVHDWELREKARSVPGTPVLYLHHAAPTLEKPAEVSVAAADKHVQDRTDNAYDMRVLKEEKRRAAEANPEKKRKRKGPSEPNPKSCLKSKKRKMSCPPKAQKEGEENEKKKRKRFRKRKNARGNDASAANCTM